MSFKTTIQLIKINSKLPKNELHNGNNYFGVKGIGKFAYDLFTNIFNTKKKTTIYMRLFDNLELSTKIDLLSQSVACAKKEIADKNLPTNTNVLALAIEWVWTFEIVEADYTIIDILSIPAWTGPLPIKFPRP
jgi:hypothetical protein